MVPRRREGRMPKAESSGRMDDVSSHPLRPYPPDGGIRHEATPMPGCHPVNPAQM